MSIRPNRIFQLLFEAPDLGGGGGGAPDISSIISSSLEGVDRGDDSDDSPAPEPEPQRQASSDDPTEEAELLEIQKDILAKNPQMKGQIDVHRHQAVLTRNRNKMQAEIEAREQKLKALEWANDPQLKQALMALALAETDQKAFIEMLMEDERFSSLISFKEAQAAAAHGTQPQSQSTANGRPGPNQQAQNPDGSVYRYYDEEGLQQLLEWERQQTIKAARDEWAKEFGPVQKEFEQRNAWNQSLADADVQLNRARQNWKGFKEHEPAIKQALIQNPDYDLHDAYRSVVVERFASETKVNRDKLREEILAEINAKPRAASPTRPSGGVERETSDDKPGGNREDAVADVIRRSLPRDR